MTFNDFLNDDYLKKVAGVSAAFMAADIGTAVASYKSICKNINEASKDDISEKDFKRICRKIFAKTTLSGLFMASILPEIYEKCLDNVLKK